MQASPLKEHHITVFRRVFAFLLLVGASVAVQGETVYVSDLLRVGVRAEAASNDSPLAVVSSGDELQVIEKAGGHVKVRTAAGITGWVNSVYVTAEPPARLRVEQLQSNYARLQKELEQVRGASGDTLEENERLRGELEELKGETSTLHDKVARLYAEASRTRDGARWVYAMVAMIALFVGGIVLGALWYRQQITTRLGGLRI
jgi:SH3 domain protein